jgi:GTP:adenosylcobinamide-phosphate guanylyltransferase
MSWTAVVLAGSRPGGDPLAAEFSIDLKALIPIAGEPMVRRPVRALLQAGMIGKVLVLGQSPDRLAGALPDDPRVEVRRSKGTIAETILALIADKSLEWPLLVTTADHALLDAATIEEFCGGAALADIAIGVVEQKNLLRRLPATKRTWLKFRGGAYTGANLFALRSPKISPAIELWRSVEQDRKKAWRILSVLGPHVVLAVACRLVSIDGVLAQLGGKLGLAIKAVRLGNPLAGVDVDKAQDHALVEAILERRA